MRLSAPRLRLEGSRLVLTASFRSDTLDPFAEVTMAVDRDLADLVDPGATPWLPLAILLGTVLGEDVVVDAPVDEALATTAAAASLSMAGWWPYRVTRLSAPATVAAPPPGTGVGLFFTRGVDSWSTLLDLLDAPPAERVTHLLAVSGVGGPGPGRAEADAELIRAHREVAAELGLPVIDITTDVRTVTDPVVDWIRAYGLVLASAGLVLGAGLRRVVQASAYPVDGHPPSGWHPDVARHLSTGATEVVLGNPRRSRVERVAHLLGHARARATLHVCWESGTSRNCGRCRKCLTTMTELLIAGDPRPADGFDGHLTPAAVRALDQPVAPAMVGPLVDALGADQEDLRLAWQDQLRSITVGGTSRSPVAEPSVPLAGAGTAVRVAAALRRATGDPDTVVPAPIGWGHGQVPLRPPADAHPGIRAMLRRRHERAERWAVVEEHDPDRVNDAAQAALVERCEATFGSGICYLPGIGWAPEAPAVLHAPAVGRLLTGARTRLWWRADGSLDSLRVVEAIEHGCIPYQVMPTGAAALARRRVPAPLAPLLVAVDDLADLDLDDDRDAATDHLLLGSLERDLLVAIRGS